MGGIEPHRERVARARLDPQRGHQVLLESLYIDAAGRGQQPVPRRPVPSARPEGDDVLAEGVAAERSHGAQRQRDQAAGGAGGIEQRKQVWQDDGIGEHGGMGDSSWGMAARHHHAPTVVAYVNSAA